MLPEQSIEVQLTDMQGAPLPLSDVLLQVMFFTSGRWRYTFDAGATDASGAATIDYASIENQRIENGKFALMDYNTKLEECDLEVKIHVLTGKDFEQRLSAVQSWYPDNLPKLERQIAESNNLKIECEDAVVGLRDHITKARVTCKDRRNQ